MFSPGSFVFWDAGYSEAYPEQPFQPAALVIIRIISVHDDIVCADLGHKSMEAENPLQRRIKFLNLPAITFVGQSEEHLVLKPDGTNAFAVGDFFWNAHSHLPYLRPVRTSPCGG